MCDEAFHIFWYSHLHTRLVQCFCDFNHKEEEKNKKGMVYSDTPFAAGARGTDVNN